MSHAIDYLKSIWTAEQYATYRAACRRDQRDSEARKRWRYVSMWQYSDWERQRQIAATALRWLQANGYADTDGKKISK